MEPCFPGGAELWEVGNESLGLLCLCVQLLLCLLNFYISTHEFFLIFTHPVLSLILLGGTETKKPKSARQEHKYFTPFVLQMIFWLQESNIFLQNKSRKHLKCVLVA